MDPVQGYAGSTGDGDAPVAGFRLSGKDGSAASAGGGGRLGPGEEFDLIRGFLADARPSGNPAVRLGPGDDCAVVDGDGIVLGTDLSIEDIHFRRAWLTAAEIGYRAAAAALSDLAAMGAHPIGVLASLAATAEDARTLAPSLMSGVREAIEAFGGEVLGGDLTRSPRPLVLDIVGVGETSAPVLRSGATPGDEVWVTGHLGASAAAVAAWQKGDRPDSAAREAYARPRPRIREARWLADRGIPRAMLDLSDGLAGDLGHMAAASGVSIVVHGERVPVSPAARESADLALTGGEDYEICFAASSGSVDPHIMEFVDRFSIPLTRIGYVAAGSGVFLETNEGRRTPLTGGFEHFGGLV